MDALRFVYEHWFLTFLFLGGVRQTGIAMLATVATGIKAVTSPRKGAA